MRNGPLFLSMILFALLIQSCQKSVVYDPSVLRPTPVPPPPSLDTFRVNINGTAFVPANMLAASTFGIINISARDSTGFPFILLVMPTAVVSGTYELGLPDMKYVCIYQPDTNGTNSQPSKSGSLMILENNSTTRRIRGNFSFTGKTVAAPFTSSVLTDGYFSYLY